MTALERPGHAGMVANVEEKKPRLLCLHPPGRVCFSTPFHLEGCAISSIGDQAGVQTSADGIQDGAVRLIRDRLFWPGCSHHKAETSRFWKFRVFFRSRKRASVAVGASRLQPVFTARPSSANIIPACLSLSRAVNLYQGS